MADHGLHGLRVPASDFEERAAILEYDGGFPRVVAETLACAELLRGGETHG